MNDQVNERLVALLDYLGGIAKDADAFARAEMPAIAREIVAWELWSNSLFLIPSIVGVFFAAWVFRKALAILKRPEPNVSDDAFGMFIISAMVGIVCIITAANTAPGIVKAIAAPRLVILDYVRSIK